MRFSLKHRDLLDVKTEPLIIRDEDGSVIISIETIDNEKNTVYSVKNGEGNQIYVIKKMNADNFNKFHIFDVNGNQMAAISKSFSIYTPVRIETQRDKYTLKSQFSNITLKLYRNDTNIIYSLLAKDKEQRTKSLMNIVYDTDDEMLGLTMYLAIGIMYCDSIIINN